MNRRTFLGGVGAPSTAAGLAPAVSAPATAWQSIVLEPGRHLFVDDYLVEASQNLTTTVHQPKKLGDPILGGIGSAHNNDQPYCTVLYDERLGRFRMWYDSRKSVKDVVHLSYTESADGIRWDQPYKEVLDVFGFPCSVLESGEEEPDPGRRYKLTLWERSRFESKYLTDGHAGVGVAFSPDGLNWTKHKPHPVLPDLWRYSILGDPQKKGSIKWREYAADCLQATWDPVRKLYVGYVKSWTWPPDETGYISSSSDGMGRRLTSLISSPDFVHWTTPARCGVPWADDFPSLEFYGCRPKARGNQMLILTCILDETVRTQPAAHGIGYTVLSTSTDLVHWNRMKKPWLDRAADAPGAPDHAMAWAADLLTVGDEEYLYYAGYAKGHKSFNDRTLNLARLRKDGFVSRDAGSEPGRLVTPLLRFHAGRMTINASVRGELRFQILGADGKPLAGFRKDEVSPITGNSTAHAVKSKAELSAVLGRPVRFEFSLRNAELYGFELR